MLDDFPVETNIPAVSCCVILQHPGMLAHFFIISNETNSLYHIFAVWIDLGTLRLQMHLPSGRTGFQTMVGQQPWSNGPLVYLLDRTQFIVSVHACTADSDRNCTLCLQISGLYAEPCQTNVCRRSHSLENTEP